MYLVLSLGLLGVVAAVIVPRLLPDPGPATIRRLARRPVFPSSLDAAPAEVQEFLARALEKIPERRAGVSGYHVRGRDNCREIGDPGATWLRPLRKPPSHRLS